MAAEARAGTSGPIMVHLQLRFNVKPDHAWILPFVKVYGSTPSVVYVAYTPGYYARL